MPSSELQRQFVDGGIYHVYNRGVEKREIFLDTQDYGVFLNRLKWALLPDRSQDRDTLNRRLQSRAGKVELLAYCLMPNHFHLLLRQLQEKGIEQLMRTVTVSYSMYFNKKYQRVGPLFQGRFRSRTIDSDPYLQHITRYIHLNPSGIGEDYVNYPYSSYRYYFADVPAWLNPQPITQLYKSLNDYREFVDDMRTDSSSILKNLTIDDDIG